MLIDGKKVACATCIKGHRATHCKHKDRPMVEIKQKGRPKTQCKQCRELRLVRQLHVKCNCGDEKQTKRNRGTNTSNNEQDIRTTKKFIMDLSNSNLRAIAPRPKESPEQQQQQPLTHVSSLLSPSLPLLSPSSSSPPRYTSYPSSSPPPPPLTSPHQFSSFPISASPPVQSSSYPISQSPPQLPLSSTSRYSIESSMGDSLSILPTAPAPSTSSSCRCRPGNSCGCKKSDGSTGSCCESQASSRCRPAIQTASSSSCCGSTTPAAAPSSSCCGSTTPAAAPSSSCCGSTTPAAAPSSSCCGSASRVPSLPSIRQRDNEMTPVTKSASCCRPSIEPPATSNMNALDTPLSPQSMLHPSAHLTLANGRTGTMCEDGLGKSSCCSSKQRNALGEIIRVVTCRCGDDCACIGCDAHPSRAMKSSQQDPYAGYSDVSIGRRRLSIAAICSNSPTSSSSSSGTSTPPPNDAMPTPKSNLLNKPPKSDMPTSVLGESGIMLCGCGCSNTLDECTDCFQELCQDYYSGR